VLTGLTLIEVLRRDYGEQWERGRLNTLMLHRKALALRLRHLYFAHFPQSAQSA